jgi:hypothetical protein
MSIDKKVLAKLNESLHDTKISFIKPDKDKLEELLSIPADRLSNLERKKLIEYIYILAQYQVFLNVQSNSRRIQYLEAKRSYDGELSLEVAKINSKKTLKEKAADAEENSPLLKELKEDLRIKEADSVLFEKIPESVLELSNALKKYLYE